MLTQLRKKPQREKNHIALGVAAFFTISIAIIWGISFSRRIARINTTQAIEDTLGPLQSLPERVNQ